MRRSDHGCCLVTKGEHAPPKHTTSGARQVATDGLPSPDHLSGYSESKEFLRRRGFTVAGCACGASFRKCPPTHFVPIDRVRAIRSEHHSERCGECKIRIGQLLRRICGTCASSHGCQRETGLAAYTGTSIDPAFRDLAGALERERGCGIGSLVRSRVSPGCDDWGFPDSGYRRRARWEPAAYAAPAARTFRVH